LICLRGCLTLIARAVDLRGGRHSAPLSAIPTVHPAASPFTLAQISSLSHTQHTIGKRLGMPLKTSNVVGNSITLVARSSGPPDPVNCFALILIMVRRRKDDLVFGTPGNRVLCLWPSISEQGSGVGLT
jgi:hypothetical protein